MFSGCKSTVSLVKCAYVNVKKRFENVLLSAECMWEHILSDHGHIVFPKGGSLADQT